MRQHEIFGSSQGCSPPPCPPWLTRGHGSTYIYMGKRCAYHHTDPPPEGIRGRQKGLCIFWGGAKDRTWSPKHVASACHRCSGYGDEPQWGPGEGNQVSRHRVHPGSAPWLVGRGSRAGVGCTRSPQSRPQTVSSSPQNAAQRQGLSHSWGNVCREGTV